MPSAEVSAQSYISNISASTARLTLSNPPRGTVTDHDAEMLSGSVGRSLKAMKDMP